MDWKKRSAFLVAALVITLACAPVLPSIAPLPTQAVGAVDTIVAATYNAAATGTAVVVSKYTSTPTPPGTLTPSQTPTVTPTGTATVDFVYRSPTPFPTSTLNLKGGGGGDRKSVV